MDTLIELGKIKKGEWEMKITLITFKDAVNLRKCLGVWLVFLLIFKSVGFAFPVKVSDSPTNDLGLRVTTILNAKKSIRMNIYEMTSEDIADALLNRIEAGIQVDILEEGQPVGGL